MSQSLQPSDGKKSNQIVKLTNRARLFIEFMCDGLKTYEAYLKAGYKGSAHASYELRRLLSNHLRERLEARGFSMEGVAQELLSLSDHPVVDPTGAPISSLTLNQKLSILKLFLQALPKPPAAQQVNVRNVTAFVVNRANNQADKVIEADNHDGSI